MLNGNKLLFLNEKAHHYRDIKISKENCVCNINAVLFLFFFLKGCDSVEKGLLSMALQCSWVLCFTSLLHKLARKVLTEVADCLFRRFGWWSDSKLTHVLTEIFGCFRDVEWMASIPWWPPSLPCLSPNGISEHGGFLEIKPERRSKENVWTGWSHILL